MENGDELLVKKKILIVEDDSLSAFLTENILKHDFIVYHVNTGYHAIEIIEKINFDVILMDINLGDINMDGIKTMRLIRNKTSLNKLKIVALTSFSKERNWYINQGFNELLIKPVDSVSLATINLLLEPTHFRCANKIREGGL